MVPRAFRTPAGFRTWLSRNHSTATELIVRCYRTHAAARGMTYAQALDEALCFGWIDGVRRSLDADSFSTRFSPRKSRSIWSLVNVAHVERLTRAGRMTESGLAAFNARDERRTGVYSFERQAAALTPSYTRRFRADKTAWAWFQSQPPGYRRTSVHWVMSATREETRTRRLDVLIACSGEATRIPLLRRT
jgi:uncharacterized protein YdeI (YjbR/CyaY-like superfamily)